MDLAGIISVLLEKAPYLLASILGFLMVLIGSSGTFRGEKLDQRTKTNIIRAGWIVFWTFLFIYSLELLKSGSLVNFLNLLVRFFSSPIVELIATLAGLLFIGLNRLRIRQIEKGYKIQSVPVTKLDHNNNSNFREAYLQVVNVGNGKITCAAQLVSVIYRGFESNKTTPVSIERINPDGSFLKWASTRKGYATLTETIPDTVQLLYSHRPTSTFNEQMVFSFAGDHNSEPIPFGYYTIQVDFLRWNGTKYIKFHEFEETLRVSYGELEWIKSKRSDSNQPKEKIKMTRTQRKKKA